VAIIGMLPVRTGSTRLKKKNYLLINDEPIYLGVLKKMIASQCFDRIVINSEDVALREVASFHLVEFYNRSPDLASSSAKSDSVVLDFFENAGVSDNDIVFWVNTASPLTKISDIERAVSSFTDSNKLSAVSVRSSRGHLLFKDQPMNFDWSGGFAQTQELEPAYEFNYAIMAWRGTARTQLRKGVLFDEDVQFLFLSKWADVLMKDEKDFEFITSIAEKK